ncbi:GFA family protein [Paracraurococcus ruber]|uniref:Alanine acetyltransferase n=2 Tax=Paracraurococcus ruber TaxID=77675 RepID=A0ABS1D1C7_9PROT|nr:GFA family protein [Paracraurococcus ruber]MBK1660306.1 alanine acetyltransferase [Paracraurococcus ruber]TDG29216.1 GFA family protein [Paracraurococcus ruber]
MRLEGSCHCGAVRFRVESRHPYPYQRCYCSICRKTQGGGGYAVNLGAEATSLRVTGKRHIAIYHARMKGPGDARAHRSPAERHFCGRCGSALWLFDARWPDLLHPFASAIDTPLPAAPDSTHIMLEFKAPWVAVEAGPRDLRFDGYPEESIADWHARHRLAGGG